MPSVHARPIAAALAAAVGARPWAAAAPLATRACARTTGPCVLSRACVCLGPSACPDAELAAAIAAVPASVDVVWVRGGEVSVEPPTEVSAGRAAEALYVDLT